MKKSQKTGGLITMIAAAILLFYLVLILVGVPS